MNFNFTFKKLMISTLVVVLVIAVFLVYALAGLGSRPVVFEDPPLFVEQYAAEMHLSQAADLHMHADTVSEDHNDSKNLQLSKDFSEEEALVHSVFFNGESSNEILQLFAHPEKAQRVKIALAFSKVNTEFTHNEESGFPEKRRQFWLDIEKHIPDIQNALYEALITSAEENTKNYIPYTLAWMPGQGVETVELLAWAARHHPDWWIRRFSVMFVVEYGHDEEIGGLLLSDRTHDPDFRVRKEVLEQRIRRFKEVFGLE